MKKKYLVPFYLFATIAAMTAISVVGCGGGGGPTGSTSSPSSSASPSAQFMAMLPAGQKGATYVGAAKCVACHATESAGITNTDHTLHNVTCENCHGPGSAHIANPTNYQQNIFSNANITQYVKGKVTPSVTSYKVCNQCHGPQVADWQSSPMSGLVEASFGGQSTISSGDLTCFRCHASNFRAQYVDVPLQAGETPAQIDEHITSLGPNQLTASGSAVTASVECVNCHDPHQQNVSHPASDGNHYLRLATSNMDTTRIGPGASAATYTTYNQICGDCHNFRGNANSSDTALPTSTSRAPSMGPQMNMLLGVQGVQTDQGGYENPPRQYGTHATAPDQCVTCHMPNASHTFLPNQDETGCAPCHSATDASTKQSAMQAQIAGQLDVLQTNLSLWSNAALAKIAPAGDVLTYSWDYTGNIAGETPTGTAFVPSSSQETADIPIQIMRARFNYWYVIRDSSYGVHNPFYTPWLLTIANNNVVQLLTALNITPATVPSKPASQLVAEFKAKSAAANGAGQCVMQMQPTVFARHRK